MKRQALALVFCLTASAALAEPLKNIKIVNDRAPDCSSLESIVRTVTHGCQTDDEKVIALYNFCRYIYYHHAYPNEPGGISALKFINVYGWGLCGGQHTVMAAIWEKAGYRWRYRGWSNPGHTTVEVFYGGRWHYLDTFLGFFAWMPDPASPGGRTIAGQEDIRANPSLVADAFSMDQARKVCYHADNRFDYLGDKVNWTAPAFLVCGDELSGVLSGVASSNDAGSPRGWGSIVFDDPGYSTDVNLGPGYSLTLDWDRTADAFHFPGSEKGPHHSCGDKDYRNCPAIGPLLEPYRAQAPARTWSNGTLLFKPDLHSEAVLSSLRDPQNVACRDGTLCPKQDGPAAFVVEMSSPYVVAKASGKIDSPGAKTEVSTDLAHWTPVDLAELTKAVASKYAYYLRVTFQQPVRGIELASIVQHNQEALPYLSPGRNVITISASNPTALGKNRLVVTYAYCPGWRDSTPERLFDGGNEIARAHFAHWSDTPVVVQKVVDQFPCTLEIPVATPKGKQPVYPRMVFLRREVLAPGQEPRPARAAPSTPAVGPNEQLATLPNPWMIGAQRPPAQPKRPTATSLLPPTKTAYVSMKGEVHEHSFVKWLKDNSDAWILLLAFDAAKLPDAERLASAKLVFYVHEAHDKTPMQVAAVALDAPFQPGAAYDFSKLGKSLGAAIVAKGNGPGAPLDPPRRYEIDVTRQVRAWAKGEKAYGLALRIVPNRAVDDGWTVRFTPAKDKPAELEIGSYSRQ